MSMHKLPFRQNIAMFFEILIENNCIKLYNDFEKDLKEKYGKHQKNN